MSIFEQIELKCPNCAAPVKFDLVMSVNAARQPDLRAAILDRSFQRQTCPACDTVFRMPPEFSYLDVKRKQFFGVWPAARMAEWQALEGRVDQSFDKSFGAASGAAGIGQGMRVRLALGWSGLNEKLIAEAAGVDDIELEMAKVAALRSLGEFRLNPDQECRLIAADDENLSFGWISSASEELLEEFSVPRQLLRDIQADPAPWAGLRAMVAGSSFVDYRRPMLSAA